MQAAPRTTQATAPNFRTGQRVNQTRAVAMADTIVGLCTAGKTHVTDRELTEAGFTDAEIRQLAGQARSLAAHKLSKPRATRVA